MVFLYGNFSWIFSTVILATILRPVRFCEIWALRDKAKGLRMRSTILGREGRREEVVWQSRSQSKFTQTKRGQYTSCTFKESALFHRETVPRII